MMNVAVVAKTEREATEIAARLGMTRSSTPLAYGASPLLGHRFSAILVVGHPNFRIDDRDWWDELLDRRDPRDASVYRLEAR